MDFLAGESMLAYEWIHLHGQRPGLRPSCMAYGQRSCPVGEPMLGLDYKQLDIQG